jgi:uncharacterized protein YdeI (YjbR/CyaY-like superfamily)
VYTFATPRALEVWLRKNHAVEKELWVTLDKKNLYAVYFRLQTAKRETSREKRIRDIVARFERQEPFH